MKKIFTLAVAALFCGVANINAQKTYILDINKIYEEASTATGQCSNATLSGGTKYYLNETTYTQDIFTVVSKEDRTYRIDLVGDEDIDYGDYKAHARLEPNGSSNSLGGRQTFIEVANAGKLTIGAWTGTSGRRLLVLPATDKTSYVNPTKVTPLLDVPLDANAADGAVYTIDLEPGLYCISQDAAIYFGYIKFEEKESTGINNIEAVEEADPNAPVYNLSGQQVTKETKGILIQNGKKFINK